MQINQERQVIYKSGKIRKVAQNPHDSVHISELYAILMVLEFPEPPNIVTDFPGAERCFTY